MALTLKEKHLRSTKKNIFFYGQVVKREIEIIRSRWARNSRQTKYRDKQPTRSKDEPRAVSSE